MPSFDHEAPLFLLNKQPSLAAELIGKALGLELPDYEQAQVISADLTDIQPAEYRADMVVRLSQNGGLVYGLIVERQRSVDGRKCFAWPMYVAGLRARLRCPVALLVIAANHAVAQWARQSIDLGGENRFKPWVLSPSDMPEVLSEGWAYGNVHLAALSVLAYGRDENSERAVNIARVALRLIHTLDDDDRPFYSDLIHGSLSEEAHAMLKHLDLRTYEYQTEFARRAFSQGRAEGRTEMILRLLTSRFGALSSEMETRIRRTSIDELNAIGDRLLSAPTLHDALNGAPALPGDECSDT